MKNGASDDDVLRNLGQLVAEDERLSPEEQELELFCAGRLPEDRLRQLEARARRDPDLARRLDAYRPLAPERRGAIADALAHEVALARGRDVAPVSPSRASPRIRGRTLSGRRWGSASAAALGAVALGALAVWFGVRAPGDGAPPLPDYALDVGGGERELRAPAAPDGSALRLRPESRLEVVLRPATAVSGEIAVAAFLASSDTIEPLAMHFETSPAGGARAAGTAAELFGARRGRWQLRLVVTRAGAAPEVDPRVAGGGDASSAQARRATVDLWLLDAH